MFVRLLMVAIILVAAVLLFAATRPNTLRVERSITINAPADVVYALISDFHRWPQWAPQDREDPAMSRTYSGAQSGVGAVSEWQGKGSTGSGHMQIVEAEPDKAVRVETDFVRPFQVHNVNRFQLQPDGAATRVTWSMEGTNLYMMKVMSVFLNMDREAGKHFEQGLRNLKAAAER
jgi:uncharacterized protein YndB with AHSA1/START domain